MSAILATGAAVAPAPSQADAEARRSRLLINLITIELILVIVTMKLAFPLGAGLRNQVAFNFVLHYAFLGIYFIGGYLRVRRSTLILFVLFSAYAFFTHALIPKDTYSIGSVAVVFFIYLTMVFSFDVSREDYMILIKRFIVLSMITACLVFFNWGQQIVGFRMFNLNEYIPPSMQFVVYNYYQPLYWNSPWIKPNAIVFLETSHVSQFIAMGLVIELWLFRRPIQSIVLALGLMASFGGTGLLLFMLSAPLILLKMRPAQIAAVIIAAPILLFVGNQIGWLDNVSERSAEVSKTKTSGYYRFVEPMEEVLASFSKSPDIAIFGQGAGTMRKGMDAAWAPYSKAFVEYGLIGAALWLLFMTVASVGHGVPFAVSWVVLVQYHLLNGAFAVPLHIYYIWLLAAAYNIHDKPAQTPLPAPGNARAAALP